MFTKVRENETLLSISLAMFLLIPGCTSDGGIAMPESFKNPGDAAKENTKKMIDIYGMSLDEARAALTQHKIRHQLEIDEDQRYCSIERTVEGTVVDLINEGRICYQRP